MMMDGRKALPQGTILDFQGLKCQIGAEIGRGSNALVYEASYPDAMTREQLHHILIKELFPLHRQGKIHRLEDGSICVEPEAEADFRLHRYSFEAGNRAHLALLASCPDQIGANLNTYPLNGTLYTLLGVSGGVSLSRAGEAPARSLRACALRMMAILDALENFHANGLAHLDIAPDNILLLGSGSRERALLIDYNSALAVGIPQQEDMAVFSVKQGYTAPEVRAGRLREIGFASDLYSVTAVFYRLIAGMPLTSFQMIRPTPPDVSGCDCVKDEPETVRAWVQEILKKGLQSLPARRYQTAAQMRSDLDELIDRIDGVGITHWALWEAGRRQVRRMVSENPALAFLQDTARLFPAMVTDGSETYPAEEHIRGGRESCMLLAGGGMGKTTALLRLALSGDARYTPRQPAVLYVSLYGWQAEEPNYIINSILDGLHFRPETHTYTDARKALGELLDRPAESPALLLLLDGLNEAVGDTQPLLDEINRLSALRGVRLVVAGRSSEEALAFPRLRLTALPDETVQSILSREGLLLPEDMEMRRLLATPLMLSMYIRAGQLEQKQIRIKTANELLGAYLSALQEKAVRDLSEHTDRRWQIDAAVNLALPAIAGEISKKHHALSDAELLPAVEKCYRLLNGRLSRRFFPQWIGRTAAIRGGAKNAEEWYGQTVHDLLWKQLGLIVRDNQGKYAVAHQVIEEYLLGLDRANRRRVKRYHGTRAAILCAALCLAAACCGAAYKAWIAPAPYETAYAENVMARALDAYVGAGRQYELLSALTACALDTPEDFDTQLELFRHALPYGGMSSASAEYYLTAMLETGKVMPWSGKPMDEAACKKLFTLAADREEEYALFASVLQYVMQDAYAGRNYGAQYPQLLSDLLETDADIAAALYQIVCTPHLTGPFADQSATANTYGRLFASISRQNEHLTGEDIKQSRETLTRLEGKRRNQLSDLYACGAFAAYEAQNNQAP